MNLAVNLSKKTVWNHSYCDTNNVTRFHPVWPMFASLLSCLYGCSSIYFLIFYTFIKLKHISNAVAFLRNVWQKCEVNLEIFVHIPAEKSLVNWCLCFEMSSPFVPPSLLQRKMDSYGYFYTTHMYPKFSEIKYVITGHWLKRMQSVHELLCWARG